MKKSANGNMYEVTLEETHELFAPYLSGAPQGSVCVVAQQPLSLQAENALASAMTSRGYGRDNCTFVALDSADESALDASALFLLLEGLDPVVVIVADRKAAESLAEAYRQEAAIDAPFRLFGRSAVAFSSFESMLEQPETKQHAWALLKKLPKFAER